MQFDIRTLVVTVALATAFCAGARFLLCRLHPDIPGLKGWAWTNVLAALALGLTAGRGVLSDVVAVWLAGVLVAVGYALSWDSFRRFLGRPTPTGGQGVLLALGLVIPAATFWLGARLELRAGINALLIALFSGVIAAELLRADHSGGVARRATGWAYLANAIFFVLRAVAVTRGDAGFSQATSDGIAAVTLLWWLGMIVAVTLGMTMMAGERLQEGLDRQASRDPLTGALNRRAFALVAERELARAQRQGQPLALLMMDLDHFKQINDRLGHAGGDAVLGLFVASVRRVLRSVDVFCRFGGEEFLVLLPDSAAAQALGVAERLRAAYRREAAADAAGGHGNLVSPLTVSVGVAEWQAGEDLESLIRRADAALYRAKALGRDRSEMATAGPDPAAAGQAAEA